MRRQTETLKVDNVLDMELTYGVTSIAVLTAFLSPKFKLIRRISK